MRLFERSARALALRGDEWGVIARCSHPSLALPIEGRGPEELPARGRGYILMVVLFVAFSLGAAKPQAAGAAEPVLSFDYGRTIECRDVTSADFAERYPDDRVVQCTVKLSVYLVSGDMSEVEAIRVELADSDQRLRVHDFSPQTTLESDFSGDIEWSKTTEKSHSINASLGGEIPCLGGVKAQVTPTIGGGMGGKEVVKESQKRVAPRQAVIASGTMNEEHGVFFTLRPSPTTSLEGVHELSVQFVVPAYWRGDAVRVACQATGKQKMLWMTQQKVWAQKSSAVALYLEGDAKARSAALRLVRQ